MSTETVNQIVDRLVQTEALTLEGFAAQLGVGFQNGEINPFWQTYTFALEAGPFAGGELRLNTPGTAALLILAPRNPPGVGRSEVDRSGFGQALGIKPNPSLPPEGVLSEFFEKNGVSVTPQWTARSRRLHNLVLRWDPPGAENPPASPDSSP